MLKMERQHELLYHLFLSKKPPECPKESFAQQLQHREIDTEILELITDFLKQNYSELEDWQEELDNIVSLFDSWSDVQNGHHGMGKSIQKAIGKVDEGRSFVFYVREQNSTILLRPHPQQSNRWIFSAFIASQSNELIYKQPGELVAEFPGMCISIPNSGLLRSEELAKELELLSVNVFSDAMRKIKKGGCDFNEPRDITHPMYVTQYLAALISDEKSETVGTDYFLPIKKKIRDQVVYSKNGGLIRRSGIWMSIKVILQLEMVNKFGSEKGYTLYKLIMLDFLQQFCNKWCLLGNDLSQQMIAKISRRLTKISENISNSNSDGLLVDLYQSIRSRVEDTVKKVAKRNQEQWKNIIAKEGIQLPWNISYDKGHIKHDLTNLLGYTTISHEAQRVIDYSTFIPPSRITQQNLMPSLESFPTSKFNQATGEVNCGLILYEFERYIYLLPDDCLTHSHARDFLEKLGTYISKAKAYYAPSWPKFSEKQDPVGASRMVLTCLKMIQMFDKLALESYNMLEEYDSGINVGIIQDLILPLKRDLILAQDIEKYFTNRTNAAKYPSLIAEEELRRNSFSTRFAANNSEMMALKSKIREEIERKSLEKLAEVDQVKRKFDPVYEKYQRLDCERVLVYTEYYQHGYWHKGPRMTHSPSCEKCKLEEQLANNYNVSIYEKYLPKEDYKQNGVVFELLIPLEIACLRDALYLFSKEICSTQECGNLSQGCTVWKDYSMLNNYWRNHYQKYYHLVSTCKPTRQSHYGAPEHRVDSLVNFVCENVLKCQYGTGTESRPYSFDKTNASIEKFCEFSVEGNSQYENLQWLVSSTKHTQNEVIAKQDQSKLSNSEYKEFGTLRAGHRIQLRNIYRAIAQSTLSFKEISVVNLISQAIWQAGPPSRHFYRESHEDFGSDSIFTLATLNLIEKFLEKIQNSWNDHYILLVLILLCNRILSIHAENENVRTKVISLLLKCRKVSIDWAKSIEELLLKLNASEVVHQTNLRLKLIEISAFGALTFIGESKDVFDQLAGNPERLCTWLKSIAKINDNLVLTKYTYENLPNTITKNLLRWVRLVGVDFENYFHNQKHKLIALAQFVKCQWNGSITLSLDKLAGWKSNKTSNQWYDLKLVDDDGQSSTIHMDVVLGQFLVNGCTIGGLPVKISQHSDFKRLFEGYIFVVQPGNSQGEYITEQLFHDCGYKFSLTNGNELIVKETTKDGNEFQLIPHTKFEKDIPYSFVKDFSHWWNKKGNYIEFRSKDFFKEGFKIDVKYKLDLQENIIEDNKFKGKYLIDCNSKTYKNMSKIISRLEWPKFMHLFQAECYLEEDDGRKEKKEQLVIELPRMGLHFYVENDSIMSKEYRGYKISNDFQIGTGTLIGLKSSLILVNEYSNPILLVPHGIPQILPGELHQQVTIDYRVLRKPEFFSIDVDSTLGRLKQQPSQCAWLYLAYLHALTASPLPDPLTGYTGTESAIQLLQSPLCWSCEPLDKESETTLNLIKKLAPKRKFYPRGFKEMETMEFTGGFPSLAASDAFRFLVCKLKYDSTRTSFAYGCKKEECEHKESNKEKYDFLSKKAYWRYSTVYSPEALIAADFDPLVQQVPASQLVSALDMENFGKGTLFENEFIKTIRELAILGRTPKKFPPKVEPTLLIKSLCNLKKLKEPEDQHHFVSWSDIDILEHWLGLYNYARKVKEFKCKFKWTMMLCAFAFRLRNNDSSDEIKLREHLKILQAIATFPTEFKDLNPPDNLAYLDTNENVYDSNKISDLLNQCQKRFTCVRKTYEDDDDYVLRYGNEMRRHTTEYNSQRQLVIQYLKSQDLTISCDLNIKFNHLTHLDSEMAQNLIESVVRKWYRNRKLKHFVQSVVDKLHHLQGFQTGNSILKLKNLDMEINNAELIKFAKRPKFNAAQIWFDKLNDKENLGLAPNIYCKAMEPHNSPFKKLMDSLQLLVEAPSRSQFPLTNQLAEIKQNDSTGIGQILDEYSKDLKDSWESFMSTPKNEWNIEQLLTTKQVFQDFQQKIRTEAKELWKKFISRVQLSKSFPELNCLIDAGISHRITAFSAMQKLLVNPSFNQSLKKLLVRIGILWCEEQKARRCIRCLAMRDSMQQQLIRELETFGYEEWNPEERPEWLLLQLELDLMIRPVQVKVAKQMECINNCVGENGGHFLNQLNMGEGKTSLIVPMLLTRLANGIQLPRITVLRSLYNTNRELLTFTIGGLLNKRVYTFPCKRDMDFTQSDVHSIQNLYEECLAKKGVVITAPEYRLSFQLKGYDECHSQKGQSQNGVGYQLIRTNDWIRENVRDILDECDEILNVKYQLIYTIGNWQKADGGDLRFETCQKVLKLLPKHLKTIQDNNDEPNLVQLEYSEINGKGRNMFPLCRILNASCYQTLCDLITNDILNPKSCDVSFGLSDLKESDRKVLFKFISNPTIEKDDHDKALNIFEDADELLDTILILRGLLAFGVLLLGLTKRWRVNYGVSPTSDKKMAVPFHAKDVASDKTEFGHTDAAILLTQLSYYYSGLNDDQIRDCFKYLQRSDDKDILYNDWIRDLEPPIDPSISELSGINLEDYNQTIGITIPTLRKNAKLIDFWLKNAVYPTESRQFPQKIMCSPWDLCSDEMKYPVTGFSGTNDTKLLLPVTISQRDLPELIGTNGQVLFNILREENNRYSKLTIGITGEQILAKLVDDKIPLLLDVGALIIDLTNEQVAEKWLNLARTNNTQYEAVVYFNEANKIFVKDYEGRVASFQLSPYRTNLGRCLIYLDDIHTRGTDLKIPLGTIGCVTLGKGVTKDKLVQGCMRMRMLGNGHTISFYASQEVDVEIHEVNPNVEDIGVKEVITWALYNSCTVTRDGFQHWLNAAANFCTKKAAHLLFNESDDDGNSSQELNLLTQRCAEDEVLELKDIFGTFQIKEGFPKLALNQMRRYYKRFLNSVPENSSNLDKVKELYLGVTKKVTERCKNFAKDVKKFSHLLDEEQEKELAVEKEMERHKENPPSAKPKQHNLADELKKYLCNPGPIGDFRRRLISSNDIDWYMNCPKAFMKTKMWNYVQEDCWGYDIYVTTDFCQVIDSGRSNGNLATGEEDNFLRPVNWIVSKTVDNGLDTKTALLLVSPFEANEIVAWFRTIKLNEHVKLHMFAARLHPDHSTFWTSPELTVPAAIAPRFHSISIKNYALLNSNLLFFSGSQFFENSEEEDAFCRFIGFVPNPRTEEEAKAFEDDWIQHGFLLPKYREVLTGRNYNISKFENNPDTLIKDIITCRHESYPGTSHMSKILKEFTKVFKID